MIYNWSGFLVAGNMCHLLICNLIKIMNKVKDLAVLELFDQSYFGKQSPGTHTVSNTTSEYNGHRAEMRLCDYEMKFCFLRLLTNKVPDCYK